MFRGLDVQNYNIYFLTPNILKVVYIFLMINKF